MVEFSQNHKAVLDEMLLDDPRVKTGKMFGYPAYYVGKKLAICLYGNGVGLKVPENRAAALIEENENIIPFQPLGSRRMREWIQINLTDSKAYQEYRDVLEESLDYVFSIQH
jgi:predicted DNA-binding protein (MmcQ/YjbR family)